MRAFTFTGSLADLGVKPEDSPYYLATDANIETDLQNFNVQTRPAVILGIGIGAAIGGAGNAALGAALMCLNGGGGGGGGGEAPPPVGQGKGGGQGQAQGKK